ncbi:MAG: RIP metalloprotease RseP [Synergistetes bacterium]|nr:RIP metalloprotease RseP [Synergistota bacterium]
MFFYSLGSFIVAIAILVLFHEGGHFVVARLLGIRVKEFSIGFGSILASWGKGEIKYSIRIVPLGGFVRFFGEDDETVEGGFLSQPLWKKALVVAAGPVMNLLIAIPFIAVVFFFNGMPNLTTAMVGGLIHGYPAETVGIRAGDRIVSVDGIKVKNWKELSEYIHKVRGKELNIVVDRRGKRILFKVKPRYDSKKKVALIGIYPVIERYNLFSSIYKATTYVFGMLVLMVVFLWNAVIHHIPLQLKGPVAIAYMAGKAASQGWITFFSFTAFLSINLALINLFPFPALDGGRLIFYLVEFLSGKKIDPKKIEYVHLVGFWILISLVVYITFRDIVSLR